MQDGVDEVAGYSRQADDLWIMGTQLFILEKRDTELLFRGSSNQRIIYLSGKEEDVIPGTVPLVPVK